MDDLRIKYIKAISEAKDENALEDVRLAALGKKGEVSLRMRELGKMTPDERKVAGITLNKHWLYSSNFSGHRGGYCNFCRYGLFRC